MEEFLVKLNELKNKYKKIWYKNYNTARKLFHFIELTLLYKDSSEKSRMDFLQEMDKVLINGDSHYNDNFWRERVKKFSLNLENEIIESPQIEHYEKLSEEWHNSNSNLTLQEYLGLDDVGYARFLLGK
jgi:hypothetical protein